MFYRRLQLQPTAHCTHAGVPYLRIESINVSIKSFFAYEINDRITQIDHHRHRRNDPTIDRSMERWSDDRSDVCHANICTSCILLLLLLCVEQVFFFFLVAHEWWCSQFSLLLFAFIYDKIWLTWCSYGIIRLLKQFHSRYGWPMKRTHIVIVHFSFFFFLLFWLFRRKRNDYTIYWKWNEWFDWIVLVMVCRYSNIVQWTIRVELIMYTYLYSVQTTG